MNKDEALRLALEALSPDPYRSEWAVEQDKCKAITAIKAALEAKDEPVAEVTSETGADITMSWWHEPALPIGTKLYTTPPQRIWVGLTKEEKEKFTMDWINITLHYANISELMNTIEQTLKDKNT